MEINKPIYPRWAGVLLGFLVPGSAHYFAGLKRAGLIWYFGLLLLPPAFSLLMTLPSRPFIIAGLALLVLAAFFNLAMLVSSFRHVERLGIKQWLAVVGIMIATLLAPNTIQIFKMSAHSMKPTLLGMTVEQSTNKTSFADGLLRGMVYDEIHVTAPGTVIGQPKLTAAGFELQIGEQTYELPYDAMKAIDLKQHYEADDLLWSGRITANDHLVVKPYLFGKPARGDIVVFHTRTIEHQHVKKDTIYTKRIVGLPGETIQINPPFVVADGNTIEFPDVFTRLNYLNDGKLAGSTDSIMLGEHEYFVLGDNTTPNSSLDSRYFGAIQEESIVGRVCSIYWPVSRIGPVE